MIIEFGGAGDGNNTGNGIKVRRKREHGTGFYSSSKKCDVGVGVPRRIAKVGCWGFVPRKPIKLPCYIRRNGGVDSPSAGARAAHKRERRARLRLWFAGAANPVLVIEDEERLEL